MPPERILLLTCDIEFGRIAANHLARRFPDLFVVVETPMSRLTLLRRRMRRQSVVRVAGQLVSWCSNACCGFCPAGGSARLNAPPGSIAGGPTRIIDGATLRQIKVPMINYHAGITPKLGCARRLLGARHGRCRALQVTVHLVDEGIDSSGILHQTLIAPSPGDNFSTYS